MSAELATPIFEDETHRQSTATFDEVELSEAWNRCFDQLRHIRSFGRNWDNAGAEPISAMIVRSAALLLNQLREGHIDSPPSRVVASPTGSVVIEWHFDDSYWEAEIEEPHSAEFMFQDLGKPSEFSLVKLHENEAKEYSLPLDAPSSTSTAFDE